MLGVGFGSIPRKSGQPSKKPKLGVHKGVHKKPVKKAPVLGVIRNRSPKKKPKVKPKLKFVHKPIENPAIPIQIPRAGNPPPVDVGSRTGFAIIGQFKTWPWGQHPDEAYLADAIESLGVPVYRVRQDWRCEPIPECGHVLFTGQPDSWNRMYKWQASHRTILWTLDWLPDYNDRHLIIVAAKRATYFASSDIYDWRGKYGIRNHIYLPGACESISVPFDPKPERPCAFMGSLYNARRQEIARIVKKFNGTVLDSPGTWVYGKDLAGFVQSTKVIVGDNARNDIPGYWSSRNYVIPGAGGFLLTSNVPGLDKDFEVGKHIAIYEGVEALEEAIRTCLQLDEEREAIRKVGYEHVRSRHSWKERAKTLLGYLKIPFEAKP